MIDKTIDRAVAGVSGDGCWVIVAVITQTLRYHIKLTQSQSRSTRILIFPWSLSTLARVTHSPEAREHCVSLL